MIFDTDILIWVQRGNEKAAHLLDLAERKFISIQTLMELLQGARNKAEHQIIKLLLSQQNFSTLPLTQSIGHRALAYIEEYSLAYGLLSQDALIAATAAEHGLTLATGNSKHFKCIKDIQLKIFRP
ncbi:MAG: type II toxin-antitoxin system VapC family toxin [Deltaproteobacteria bacterium]|nr:type II toxin-antitoxin system VapC family toxin [Deltaproteobacteria bacterium]